MGILKSCWVLLGLLSQVTAQTMDPCDFKYFYANTGDDFANDDLSVNVACLEPGGCETIIYARASCGGCFEPGCTEAGNQRRVFHNVAQGDVEAVLALQYGSGDLICSTGQVAAISRDSTTALEEAHEWPGTNLIGTRFVYLTQRANEARCTVYSFESASVTLADEDGAVGSATLTPFSAQTFGPFNALDDLLTITSDLPVMVSCWNVNVNDFVVLEPVTTNPVYGFSSNQFRGMQVDCSTLENTLNSTNLPTCVNSNGGTITLTYTNGNRHFDLPGAEDGSRYAGRGIKCTPVPGNCISAGTVADGDGSEGTTSFSTAEFGTFFAAPQNIDQVVFLSADAPVTCIASPGGAIFTTATGSGGASEVHKIEAGQTTLFTEGTTFACSGPTYVVASLGQDEFNLFGLKDPSEFSYIPPPYTTCAPTSSPTTSAPSSSPTTSAPSESPTTSSPSVSPTTSAPSTSPTTSQPTGSPVIPTDSPTFAPTIPPTVNVPLIAGSSTGVVVVCALAAAIFVLRRRWEKEARKDSMMLNPDIFLEDEGFGEKRDEGKGVKDFVGPQHVGAAGGMMAAISATLRRKKKDDGDGKVDDKTSVETEDGETKEAMIEPGTSKKGAGLISALGASLARKKPAEKEEKKEEEKKDEDEESIDEELEASLLTFGRTNKRKAGSDFEVDLDKML